MQLVRVSGVTKSFGSVRALDGASFEISEGVTGLSASRRWPHARHCLRERLSRGRRAGANRPRRTDPPHAHPRLERPRRLPESESFQKTGSFKARGALNRLAALTPEERERGVVTWSAGNHAQAVAWAAAEEGVDCLVQMWEGVSPLKVEATRCYGATVDLSQPDPAAAYDCVLEIVEEQGRASVHPHSDPLVVAGHGTLALESCSRTCRTSRPSSSAPAEAA